ncbi:MAG: methyltransferase family protein [Candidatus Hodarchaeales archaeon]|jgi:protein-S-isoprenylcysteine O-methyltransferase Ste14
MSTVKLTIQMIFSIPFIVLFIGVLLFIPANTTNWLEGWLFNLSLALYVLVVFVYFMIKDPSTLERRSKLSGSTTDKIFLTFFGIDFLLIIVLPGFDYQFQWSPLPPLIVVLGFLGLILSYIIIFLVMRENSFASKGLTIHEGQEVITTGPYAIVRHPMYVGFTIMAICIPLALGSLVSLFPALLAPFFLAFRIRNEEEMLKKELQGYTEYMKKVRYRLIPKIW